MLYIVFRPGLDSLVALLESPGRGPHKVRCTLPLKSRKI